MGKMTGKAALVTGGAAGIGRAVVERLVEEGADVYATDLNGDQVAELANSLSTGASRVVGLQHNTADEQSWRSVMAQIDRRLDVVVNNAGIGGYKPIRECSLEFWQKVMSVNLDGVFLGCRFGIEAILGGAPAAPEKGGSIVNISSAYGIVGRAGSSAYCASKGGVRLLTKALALEAGQNNWNIRVNSVHPGFVETPLISQAIKDRGDRAQDAMSLESLAALHPIGRVAQPREIADAVLFLACGDSSFVTGSEMVVDGGYSAA